MYQDGGPYIYEGFCWAISTNHMKDDTDYEFEGFILPFQLANVIF